MDYREPSHVAAGDTITWTRRLTEYPATDGWTLNYAFRGPDVKNFTSVADGSDHLVTVTGLSVSGTYRVQGYVEKGAERHTLFNGRIKVSPNLFDAEADYDGRSHAEKVIEAIEAVIEGRASKDQQEMWIDGEKLVRQPFEILISIRNKYRHELAADVRKEKRKNGRRSGRSVKISF